MRHRCVWKKCTNDIGLVPTGEQVLRQAFELKEKIQSISDERKKDLIIRAIDWYHRGTNDTDQKNAFTNYWIGFELLSFGMVKALLVNVKIVEKQ